MDSISLRKRRMSSVSPSMAIGEMTAHTREPSGRRAFRIGISSLTVRPHQAAILSMICLFWRLSSKTICGAGSILPARSMYTGMGPSTPSPLSPPPLTMISEIVGSPISFWMGPRRR